MTRYGLRARVITLTLAPTLIIGLLLSGFFSFNRYQDQQKAINREMQVATTLAVFAMNEKLRWPTNKQTKNWDEKLVK